MCPYKRTDSGVPKGLIVTVLKLNVVNVKFIVLAFFIQLWNVLSFLYSYIF